MIIDPTREDRQVLRERVLRAIDVDSLSPPKVLRSTFSRLVKNLSFGRGSTQSVLSTACNSLLIYGHFDRVFRVSVALGEIDRGTWIVDYNYVRGIIHHTAYVAHRSAFIAEIASLEPFVRLPESYAPQPSLMRGEGMRLPFEEWDLWNAQPADMTSTIAGEALTDLVKLSTMWLFGGSREWPRERIDAFYDSTVEQIKQLPGWEKW